MEIIKVYYNSLDIQPKVLLHHFLRYLGVYLEENTNEIYVHTESLVDVYIISDKYMLGKNGYIDVKNEDKTILVFNGNYSTSVLGINTVKYKGIIKFLPDFLDVLFKIVETQDTKYPILMRGDPNWKDIIKYMANKYLSNNLLQASLLNRCFYKQEELYNMAVDSYVGFIRDLEKGKEQFGKSDLLQYALAYSKYEFNIICKNNFYDYLFDPKELWDICEMLQVKYIRNEELYLLKADIRFELQNNWLWACDDYADSHILHCAYADYKRGKIFREYLQEYVNAEIILKRAIEKKGDYIYAWYQLGACYEEQAKYQQAIYAFNKILIVLKEKYVRNLLAPMELEYLFKAIMRIAAIYKTRLGDYTSAYAYNDLAETIREKSSIKNYLELVWKSSIKNFDKEKMFKTIDKTIKEQVNIKLDEIY